MFRALVAGILAAALPLAAFAGAVAESVKGDVQAGGVALAEGQRVAAPTAISTGPGAQVFLRFEDGMQIVLGENSLLRMIDVRFTSSGVTDRAVFELLRGGARVVTGRVAANDPRQFYLRTPQTQLTIERPADFTVALVNPAYITVNSGTVLSSNSAGFVSLGAGSTSAVAGSSAAPASVPAPSLPASASTAIQNLAAASVAPPAGGSAAGAGQTAGGGGFLGFTAGEIVVIGAVVAGIAAAAKANEDEPSQPAATTHH